MNVMSLDCEFNQPSGKTIEIGASAWHVRTKTLLGTFRMLVNPGEPIEPRITELTGITNEDVNFAPTIDVAYAALKVFAKKHRCWKNPLVWGAGVRNDSQAIHEEAFPDPTKREENFMGYRVLDVKAIYQSVQLFHNKQASGTLREVCDILGIVPNGKEHTALPDSIDAFQVWHTIIGKFEGKGFR